MKRQLWREIKTKVEARPAISLKWSISGVTAELGWPSPGLGVEEGDSVTAQPDLTALMTVSTTRRAF